MSESDNYGNWIFIVVILLLLYVIYKDSSGKPKKIIAVVPTPAVPVSTSNIVTPTAPALDHTTDATNINTVDSEIKPISTTPTVSISATGTDVSNITLFAEKDYEGSDRIVLPGEKIKLVEISPYQAKPHWYYKSIKIDEKKRYQLNIKFVSRIIDNEGSYMDYNLEFNNPVHIYNIRDIDAYLKDANIEIPENSSIQVVIYLTSTTKVKVD